MTMSPENKKKSLLIFIGGTIALSCISLYFSRKNKKEKEKKIIKYFNDKRKKREVEIKLLQKKAAESYQYECQIHGLVILESYYGNSKIIEEMKTIQNKISFLEQNPEKKTKIIDVTIPLRFQVNDSNLVLYGHSKKHLFGFFNPSNPREKNSLLIKYAFKNKFLYYHISIKRYYANKILKEEIYSDRDEINIKADK